MASATLISYGSWTVPTATIDANIPWDSYRDVWQNQHGTRPRAGQPPAIASSVLGERRVIVDFLPKGALTLDLFADTLLQGLVPTDLTPKLLVVQRPDGVQVQRLAVIEKPNSAPADASLDTVRVVFLSSDPVWRKTSMDSFGPFAATYSSGANVPDHLDVTVNGFAPALPVITIVRTGINPGFNNAYRHKRSFTLTNNGTKTWRKHPIMVSLGDTTGGWTIEAQLALFLNGKPQRRQLVGLGLKQTYLWLVVDNLAPGKSLTYDLVWDADAVDVLQLSGKNAPAIDRSWWNGTSSGGNTSTTINTGATTFETNQWQRASIRILTGTGAGQPEQLVASNTATQITINGTWSVTPDATSTYLVYHSANNKWTYAVRQTQRTGQWNGGTGTGLYWINKTQTKPDASSFDVPGGWFPYSFLKNRDERNQETGGTPVDIGGGDIDYFGILDPDRTWQDGAVLRDAGLADGLMFSCPRPITQWRFDGLLKNPNGMCKGFYGSRSAGSLGWTTVREESTANDVLTHFGTTTFVLDAESYQLVMALLPINDQEIPLSWAKDVGTATTGDNGTATSGTVTTLTDTTKSWGVNQWQTNFRLMIIAGTGSGQERAIASNTANAITISGANFSPVPDATSQYVIVSRTVLDDSTKQWAVNQWVNARARITDGRGQGAQATVTANTATRLTANFGVNTDSTSRYELTNKRAVATLRTDAFFYLVLDDSTVGISAISADAGTNNALAITVRRGGGVSPTAPYQRVRIGVGRRIFMTDIQQLGIDCEAKRVGFYFGGVIASDLTDAVVVEDVDAAGNVSLATDWMRLLPGLNVFYVDNPSYTAINMTVNVRPGYWS